MKRIYKYPLNIGTVEVTLPKGAQVLSVVAQHNTPVLYALVDSEEKETQAIALVIHGTGHNANDVEGTRFLSTLVLDEGALVFHVFLVL